VSNETPETIFARAGERARQMGLPYAGAVTPAEAHRLLEAKAARIVDVRTPPVYTQVGHIPGTPLVVWPRDGDDTSLAAFVEQMQAQVAAEQPVLLLCRSGARSHNAAHLLTHNGFTRAYNILEGFEGPPNSGKGWLAAGLPSERG
jgi:rhodanese-related sulfurtransferase